MFLDILGNDRNFNGLLVIQDFILMGLLGGVYLPSIIYDYLVAQQICGRLLHD